MANKAAFADVQNVLAALGDPTRRAIVDGLARGPATISILANALGVTRTAVGQHIVVLVDCGLVQTEKLGRVRTCSINPTGLGVLQDWIDFHRKSWERHLDRLGEVILEDKG